MIHISRDQAAPAIRDAVPAPAYQTQMSAGFDLCAAADGTVWAGQTRAIPTGLYLKRTNWLWRFLSRWFVFELQIRPRSSLTFRGIGVANAPGTVDVDFPKEINVLVRNNSLVHFDYRVGDRIGQGVVALAFRARGVVIKKVERTGGFGSTNR